MLVPHADEPCGFEVLGSGAETGSCLRLMDFVYHSTLGLRLIKKKKSGSGPRVCGVGFRARVSLLPLTKRGLGFGLLGLGFRDEERVFDPHPDESCGVWGLGFGVWGLEFRGLVFRVQGSGITVET